MPSNNTMRKDVIEYVDESYDEDLPEVQMYDTGRLNDSQDNSQYMVPTIEEGFDNLQDSIYIAKQKSGVHDDDDSEEEK